MFFFGAKKNLKNIYAQTINIPKKSNDHTPVFRTRPPGMGGQFSVLGVQTLLFLSSLSLVLLGAMEPLRGILYWIPAFAGMTQYMITDYWERSERRLLASWLRATRLRRSRGACKCSLGSKRAPKRLSQELVRAGHS